jgi:two-component system sensor histidine kinase VicK
MPGTSVKINHQLFLTGGGEMGNLIRAVDWDDTPLGDPDNWPIILKHFTSLVLTSPSPMLICWGNEYTQIYNDAFRPILGNNKHPAALGISAADTYAEVWTILAPMFTQVMAGETVSNPELKLEVNRNGYIEDLYFNFSYNPIRDEQGHIGGILVICIETTNQIKALQELERSTTVALNANQELDETQKNLNNLLNILTESDFKFRLLIKEAPVAIALLNGPDMVIEAANDHILNIWGKSSAIIGASLANALPELVGQPFFGLMKNVLKTGEIYCGNEVSTFLEQNGVLKEGYYNFTYQPVKDESGKYNRLMVVATDVTEQVNNRRELENAYERARLAKEAAQLGTFDMDLINNKMDWDDRCRVLFGISHHNEVSYEKDFLLGLHPDDKERIIKVIADVMDKAVSNGNYDTEYRTIGAEDQKLRWVRAKGKAYFDEWDKPIRFIGSVLDITEQKQDELRKNDFIGMVSHELKTPLTSLKAYVQVLNVKAKKSDDTFASVTLDKVEQKVKAMETMINGFLNISRLESGKLSISKQQFNLDDLLREVIDEVYVTSSNHDIIFNPCPPVVVFADKDKIGSVAINLLSNAVKYSPKGKVIELTCKTVGDRAQVSIKDEGIGVKPQDITRLFDRYYRVESKNTAHISGFGIGLYLSSEIIKQHQGHIWAESTPGNGSTFHFSIPLIS